MGFAHTHTYTICARWIYFNACHTIKCKKFLSSFQSQMLYFRQDRCNQKQWALYLYINDIYTFLKHSVLRPTSTCNKSLYVFLKRKQGLIKLLNYNNYVHAYCTSLQHDGRSPLTVLNDIFRAHMKAALQSFIQFCFLCCQFLVWAGNLGNIQWHGARTVGHKFQEGEVIWPKKKKKPEGKAGLQ